MVIYIKSGVFMAVSKECAAMYTFTDLPNPLLSRREDRRFLWNVSKFLPDQRYLNPQDIHTYYVLCTYALRYCHKYVIQKEFMLGSAKGRRTSERRRCKKHCHV